MFIYLYTYYIKVGGDDAARARGGRLYEEFTRLAETRLAQNILNYVDIA